MTPRTKSRTKSSIQSRQGATLVELMIVMSACSVVLTTSAVLMHRVFRAHSQAQAFLASQRNGQRFAEQLRRDIRRAKSAEIGEAISPTTAVPPSTEVPISVPSVPPVAEVNLTPPTAPAAAQSNAAEQADALLLRLELVNGTQAEYRWHGGTVSRVESVSGRTLSRDEFTFPVQAELRARRLDAPARIVVTISSEVVVPEAGAVNAPPPAHATRARFEIAATLGRDARYVDAPNVDATDVDATDVDATDVDATDVEDPREQEEETVR